MNKLLQLSLIALLSLLMTGKVQSAEVIEKIYIDADHMKANIITGHSVYTGNVKVTQGQLVLTGDKITVVQKNNEVEVITVIGKPARYKHLTEEGEVIKANSEKMVYIASKNMLTLTINANLNHPEYQINSQIIKYNTLTKVAIAGDKNTNASNERVKITLTPKSQTADKDSTKEKGSKK